MVLGPRAETLDPVDVIFLVCKPFRMIDTEMLEFRYIQYVTTSPAVLIDDTVWHNFELNNGIQCC